MVLSSERLEQFTDNICDFYERMDIWVHKKIIAIDPKVKKYLEKEKHDKLKRFLKKKGYAISRQRDKWHKGKLAEIVTLSKNKDIIESKRFVLKLNK